MIIQACGISVVSGGSEDDGIHLSKVQLMQLWKSEDSGNFFP